MATNQGGVQEAVRARSGTTLDYNGDWLAMMDIEGYSVGTFNERLLGWLNSKLGTSYASLSQAQQAFAVAQGFNSWTSMNTFVLESTAEEAIASELYGGLSIDFTDATFLGQTGLYGSAYVRTNSYAEVALTAESLGFAVDFTDASQVPQGLQTTYGSAYIKA